ILLSAVGFAQPNLIGAALFYLVSSTLALSALFLLAELIERSRSANEIPLEDESELLPRPQESLQPPKGINLKAIAPGYVDTNNTQALRADPDRSAAILWRIPAGRWCETSD
ncbi:hypothetical protein ACOI9Y_33290, partial [Mesorhizobium japonicum]